MRFCVVAGEHKRVIIASDGLWDFCSRSRAAKVARRARTPSDAAYRLAQLAWTASHQRLDRLKDDTTVRCRH